MSKTQILYVVVTKSWRDKQYGNSYSSARIIGTATGRIVGIIGIENGDSRYCEQVSLAWLRKHRGSKLDHSRVHYSNELATQQEVRNWGRSYE